MIFDVLKSRWLRKQQDKLRKESRERKPTKSSSMVILHNLDTDGSDLFLEKWAKDLGVKKVSILGFTKDNHAVSTPECVILNSRSIKWTGGIADEHLSNVLKSRFDLQINFFDDKNDLLTYAAMALQASFKVGIPSQPEELYDLAIDVKLNQKETFITELKKYLNIITR